MRPMSNKRLAMSYRHCCEPVHVLYVMLGTVCSRVHMPGMTARNKTFRARKRLYTPYRSQHLEHHNFTRQQTQGPLSCS